MHVIGLIVFLVINKLYFILFIPETLNLRWYSLEMLRKLLYLNTLSLLLLGKSELYSHDNSLNESCHISKFFLIRKRNEKSVLEWDEVKQMAVEVGIYEDDDVNIMFF